MEIDTKSTPSMRAIPPHAPNVRSMPVVGREGPAVAPLAVEATDGEIGADSCGAAVDEPPQKLAFPVSPHTYEPVSEGQE